jgi:hypothetical protein
MNAPPSEPKSQATNPPPPGEGDVLASHHQMADLAREWAAAHPKCMDSGAKENNTYFKLSKTVTDGELNGNIAKVIRRVAKNVVIEK